MKRATVRLLKDNRREPYFNPRPREEGDSRLLAVRLSRRYFNPRPREEGDYTSGNIL